MTGVDDPMATLKTSPYMRTGELSAFSVAPTPTMFFAFAGDVMEEPP